MKKTVRTSIGMGIIPLGRILMWHLLVIMITFLMGGCRGGGPPVQDGDIIFHTSRSSQSLAIQRATDSPYSHMGVIFYRGGQPYVFEAISTVQYTPLDRWIARGKGRHYVVKRLRDASTVLTPAALARLRAAAERYQGRPYDLTFEWSDDRIYCSELILKLFERTLDIHLGDLEKIRDLNLSDPIVRTKLRERYGDGIPLDEPVISPRAVSGSRHLVMIVTTGCAGGMQSRCPTKSRPGLKPGL